ncbi:MAG TPA: hypothetical protein DDY82_03070 [Clostridiales bacterium]|nr:hypothetical protein [Clostridiales bacterium]
MNLEKIYEKRKHFDRKENVAGICMAIIPVLGFLIFGLVPMVLGIGMSFFKFDDGEFFFRIYPASAELEKVGKYKGNWSSTFVGFDNYVKLFVHSSSDVNSGLFLETLVTTVVQYIATPVCLILSLIIAFFLSKKIKCKNLLRTIYLLPFICSSVAIALIWGEFFGFSNGGTLNEFAKMFWNKKPVNWTNKHFYLVVFIVNIWGGTGFQIILFTAALTNVNNSYYEAAKVDGANATQIFFKITLPAISPTTFYLFITGTIGALQAYAVPDMIAKIGAPAPTTLFGVKVTNPHTTVIAYINNLLNGGGATDPGLACSAGVVLALIIGVITIFNFLASKYWVSYD